MKQTLQAKFIN